MPDHSVLRAVNFDPTATVTTTVTAAAVLTHSGAERKIVVVSFGKRVNIKTQIYDVLNFYFRAPPSFT